MDVQTNIESKVIRPKSAISRRKGVKIDDARTVDGLDQSADPCDRGIFGKIIDWDISLTSSLGLCVDKSSSHGKYRPLMKVLEISCHGVPWIAYAVTGLFFNEETDSIQFHTNLLMSKYHL